MYAYISGIATEIGLDYCIIEANGVGYLLFCSSNTLNKVKIDEKCKLLTHLHVAEDVFSLYGFSSEEERNMFRNLTSVTRIGNKTALSILSMLTVEDITMAIITENAAAFDCVSGIGRKTAARLLLELKEKVSTATSISKEAKEDRTEQKTGFSMRSEAIEALVALGYDGLTAGRAVGNVADSEFSSVKQLIKLALAQTGGNK
ncbi:MAG: Holliday junction branch migration protein RuvA [Clostridiales bacterium]|jgi:Holliday junction DNA helicase RuvA|nr:Holliday junction branch migration protein RuvA [Clostridiales bacterium]